MATHRKENQPERPFSVSEQELEKIRAAWSQSEPGEDLFKGPIIREIEHYFDTSLSNSQFALENLKNKISKDKIQDQDIIARLEEIIKNLAVCSEIGKLLFRYGCAE